MSFSIAPIIGGIADAWGELRTHKLRVMLSLIGITISAVFRDDLVTGRTFREGDAELLAPPIMVSEFPWT